MAQQGQAAAWVHTNTVAAINTVSDMNNVFEVVSVGRSLVSHQVALMTSFLLANWQLLNLAFHLFLLYVLINLDIMLQVHSMMCKMAVIHTCLPT